MITSVAIKLKGVCSCFCTGSSQKLFLEWDYFPPDMLSSKIALALDGSCPKPVALWAALLQLRIATPPGWQGLAFRSCLLWPRERCSASHHPRVHSGNLCDARIWCQATLFLVVKKMYLCFCWETVRWPGFCSGYSIAAICQNSVILAWWSVVIWQVGLGLPKVCKRCWLVGLKSYHCFYYQLCLVS